MFDNKYITETLVIVGYWKLNTEKLLLKTIKK